MRKILYIIQGTNLNLKNKSLEYISSEPTEVLFLYFDNINFNKNGSKNSYLPYTQSLNTYIYDLKQKGVKVEYVKVKSQKDPLVRNTIKDLIEKFEPSEIVEDRPLFEPFSYYIDYISKDFNIKFSSIINEYPTELGFHNSFKGATALLDNSYSPSVNWLNIRPCRKHNYSEMDINLKLLLSKDIFYERIRSKLSVIDFGVSRNETYNSTRISPYVNTGYLSIYELVSELKDLYKTPSGFVFFRELAFNVIALRTFQDFKNEDLSFEKLSSKILSEACLENFKLHGLDKRPYSYTYEELENSKTHSDLFNETSIICKQTGFLHNRIRMWWMSWLIGNTKTYKEAYDFAIRFQNKWSADSRHPVMYYCVIKQFTLNPKREEPVYGRMLRMVEPNARLKIGSEYLKLAEKAKSQEISYNDLYLTNN